MKAHDKKAKTKTPVKFQNFTDVSSLNLYY